MLVVYYTLKPSILLHAQQCSFDPLTTVCLRVLDDGMQWAFRVSCPYPLALLVGANLFFTVLQAF